MSASTTPAPASATSADVIEVKVSGVRLFSSSRVFDSNETQAAEPSKTPSAQEPAVAHTAAEDAAAEANAAEEMKKQKKKKRPTSSVAGAEANAAEEEAENKKRKKRPNKSQNRAKKHKKKWIEKLVGAVVVDCMLKYGLSLEVGLFTKHTGVVRDYFGIRRFKPR
jgi:histone-lysine N-methyltransferase SETD2